MDHCRRTAGRIESDSYRFVGDRRMAKANQDLCVIELAVDAHGRFRRPSRDIEAMLLRLGTRMRDALLRALSDVPLRARAEPRKEPREEHVPNDTDAEDRQRAAAAHEITSACGAIATAIQVCCVSTPREWRVARSKMASTSFWGSLPFVAASVARMASSPRRAPSRSRI